MSRRAIAGGLVALVTANLMSCADAAVTEIVVIAEPQPRMLGQSPSLAWTVTNLVDGRVAASAASAKWNDDGKYTLGLSPHEGRADSEYALELSAQRAGQTIATARLVSGYVAGETRYVTLALDDSCATPCDANSTCYRQRCVPARADEQRFSPIRNQAPRAAEIASAVGDDGGVRVGTTAAADAAVSVPVIDVGDRGASDAGAQVADAASAEARDAATPDASAPTTPAVTATIPLARGNVTLTRTDCPPQLSCSTSGLASVRDLQNTPIQFCVVRNGALPGLVAPACRQDSDCAAAGLTSSVCNDGVFCVSFCSR